jgi:uncharacterized oligopeptide transporter (OPT) family protein
VDETGKAVYLVDPGINGTVTKRPDGSEVRKFDAPKATLVSYIIKGILSHKLPWALVLFGVMIAIVLEMSGIPSLAFAVGVYLPLATSMPVFIGGAVRWLVDRKRRTHPDSKRLTEEEHIAEGDKSPGVLMASGYMRAAPSPAFIIAFMIDEIQRVLRLVGEVGKSSTTRSSTTRRQPISSTAGAHPLRHHDRSPLP